MQTETPSHHFYFAGYSDDVVIAGPSRRRKVEEYYGSHFLLSNGVTAQVEHGNKGWEMKCSDASAVLIAAVDLDDDGVEHADERIPEWLDAAGYSPVLIIASESPIEIVSKGRKPFHDTSKGFILAAQIADALSEELDVDEGIDPEIVLAALRKFVPAMVPAT